MWVSSICLHIQFNYVYNSHYILLPTIHNTFQFLFTFLSAVFCCCCHLIDKVVVCQSQYSFIFRFWEEYWESDRECERKLSKKWRKQQKRHWTEWLNNCTSSRTDNLAKLTDCLFWRKLNERDNFEIISIHRHPEIFRGFLFWPVLHWETKNFVGIFAIVSLRI